MNNKWLTNCYNSRSEYYIQNLEKDHGYILTNNCPKIYSDFYY